MGRTTLPRTVPLVPLILLVVGVWPFLFPSPYELRLLTLTGIYTLLVLGYQFIFGHAGALSLLQGSFFGLGAYVSGLLAARLGLGFAVTLLPAVVGPTLLALLVAKPILRLESHYLALATLAVGQVVFLAANSWEEVTGGANGVDAIPGIVLFGHPLSPGWPLLLFVWGMTLLGMAVAWQAMRGLFGQAYQVMREDALAADSLGIDRAGLRLSAFLLSAAFAGAAGALYVHTMRLLSPDVLQFPVMISCLSMTVIGGRTRVGGAVIGAFLLVHLPEWFRILDTSYLIAYGLALLVMVAAAPDGLIGIAESLVMRVGRPRSPLDRGSAGDPSAHGQADATSPLLTLTGVTKGFGGVTALDDVSLSVAPGAVVGLIGPNGSGKTTLINIISGFYQADGGQVFFNGADLGALPAFRRSRLGIARTFQTSTLIDTMSALDTVAIGRAAAESAGLRHALGELDGQSLRRARWHALACLDAMGAAEVAALPVGELAHGMRRRVEIARALSLDPRLLLLDEPAAGLDEAEQADLALRLRRQAADGRSVLVIEHNMPFLLPLADHVVCLDEGRVLACGAPHQIVADPLVVEAFLGTAAGAGR